MRAVGGLRTWPVFTFILPCRTGRGTTEPKLTTVRLTPGARRPVSRGIGPVGRRSSADLHSKGWGAKTDRAT